MTKTAKLKRAFKLLSSATTKLMNGIAHLSWLTPTKILFYIYFTSFCHGLPLELIVSCAASVNNHIKYWIVVYPAKIQGDSRWEATISSIGINEGDYTHETSNIVRFVTTKVVLWCEFQMSTQHHFCARRLIIHVPSLLSGCICFFLYTVSSMWIRRN